MSYLAVPVARWLSSWVVKVRDGTQWSIFLTLRDPYLKG